VSAALDDKTLRIVRVFNAPRERVFDAWIVQDNFIQWMCPPNVHVSEVKLDVRPGGAWHLRGRNASRNFVTSGKYVEIKQPERLVFTWAHHETNDLTSPRGHETTVHLEFRALDAGFEVAGEATPEGGQVLVHGFAGGAAPGGGGLVVGGLEVVAQGRQQLGAVLGVVVDEPAELSFGVVPWLSRERGSARPLGQASLTCAGAIRGGGMRYGPVRADTTSGYRVPAGQIARRRGPGPPR